ncbi:MAG: ABC transporter substrate-binding protein [Thermodesulfobacteriota bacterium]|jgi:branched-chain amino acid transport system substrate-binding protein
MEKTLRSAVILGLIVSLGFLVILPSGYATSEPGESVKIGAIFPVTGSLALLGEQSFRGAELARLDQNKKGGLFGKQIEFVKSDAPDAKAAVAEAERLITVEKMKVILGTYSSSLSAVASEVAERNGVIYWEQGAVADDITKRGFKYLFRTAPRASDHGISAVKLVSEVFAPKVGLKVSDVKMAIIYEDSLWGTSQSQFVREGAKGLGIKIVADESYSSKAVDLTPLVMRLKQAKPDVIIATQYANDAVLFQKQAKELNLYVKAFIGTGGGTNLASFQEALGPIADGVLNVGFGNMTTNPKMVPEMGKVLKAYRETYKEEPPSIYPFVNYTGTMFLFDTIKKAGSMEPDKIRQAAMTMDVPLGKSATGWGLKFAPVGDPNAGQNMRAIIFAEQWQKGRLVTIYPDAARPSGIEVILPLPPWSKRQ